MINLEIFEDARLGSKMECVDMKDIHEGLDVQTRYSTWIVRRIKELKLVEGEDFVVQDIFAQNCAKINEKGRPTKQYIFTIKSAKLVCAQEGTDKGIQYANYLISRDEKLQAIETHSMLPFDLNSVSSLQLLSQQLSTALIEEKTAHSHTKEELKEERQLSEQRKEQLDNINNNISYTACAKEIHSGLSCVVFKYWLVCQGFLSPKGVMPSKDCEDGLFIYEGGKTIVKNGIRKYVSGQWKVTQKGCRVLKERWMKFESTNPNYLADVKIAYSKREKSKGLILGSLFEVVND